MRTSILASALLLSFALAEGAAAKDQSRAQAAFREAKALAEKRQGLAAAERFGEAIALAQAAADLETESQAAEALDDIVSSAPRPRPATGGAGATGTEQPTSSLALLAAAMRKLDPARCGAFVSAPVLARNVLLAASESGEMRHVPDAAAVAAKHAMRAGSGRCAEVVARYAEGLCAILEKRPADATAPLQSATEDAAKSGWPDLATHAGTELAVAWLAAGDEAKATAAVAAVAARVPDEMDGSVVSRWMACLNARLADAPAAVRKPADDAIRSYPEARRAGRDGGAGGAGAAGGAAGEEPVSDVGRLFRKLAAGKSFVSVTCTAAGHDVRWATAPKKKLLRPFSLGEQFVDEGGVTLGFAGRSVALRRVDLVGLDGKPGDHGDVGPVRAHYLLADGETWSVTKSGVVTISR